MATTVKNVGRIPLQVGIILANGKKTSIRVMQRSPKPVGLPEGSRIDENWFALNGKNILVKNTEVANSAPLVSTPAASTPVLAEDSATDAKDPVEKNVVASTTNTDTSKE